MPFGWWGDCGPDFATSRRSVGRPKRDRRQIKAARRVSRVNRRRR